VLGALVVPTTIGPSSAEESDDSTPQPVARDDMDAMAATCRRPRFRMNTRTLLDLPYQGSADHTAAPRPLNLLVKPLVDRHLDDDVVIVL
jgi:hypothetical protein